MAEEKFISIEYSVWNRKYKPMEEKMTRLELELMQCKVDKEARIHLNFGRGRFIDRDICVGYLDMSITPPTFVKGDRRTHDFELTSLLRDKVTELLERNTYYRSYRVMDREEAEEYERRVVAQVVELKALIEKNDKLWAKIKQMPQGREVVHDSLPYTKFFKPGANGVKHLSIPASNLFNLICARLEINSKQICLNEDDFIDHFGYAKGSKRLFYKAVIELAGHDIIKKKAKFARCYWINANIIFNGDRTKITGATIAEPQEAAMPKLIKDKFKANVAD